MTTKHTAGLRWRSAADVPNSVLYSAPMTPTAPTLRGARPGAGSGDRGSALWDLMVRRDGETALAAPGKCSDQQVSGAAGRTGMLRLQRESRKEGKVPETPQSEVLKPGRPFVRARG